LSARGKARKRALDILYSAELRGVPAAVVMSQEPIAQGAARTPPPPHPYVAKLIEGVTQHQARIDGIIRELATGWELDRMPAVDRNLLRIGVFEMLWELEVPGPVVIDEAVGLAGQLSTDESPGFINGLLARVMEMRGEDPPHASG
jgi:transcription antitermination protein NusB